MPPQPKIKVRPVGMDEKRQQGWLDGIAQAEGYGKPDTVPTRSNNPGDLKVGDIGYGREPGGITHFPNPEAGYNALAKQVNKFYIPGPNYDPSMSLQQIAEKYTGKDRAPEWAKIVGSKAGMDPSARLIPDKTEVALGMPPDKYAIAQAHQEVASIVPPPPVAQPVGIGALIAGIAPPPPKRENNNDF